MTFFLVRHGETDWNKEEVFRGKKDIPLNERGRDQAKRTAKYLENFKVDGIYSSPLLRAKETASIISEMNGVPVYIMEELIDMDFGVWEGLSLNQVQTAYPEEFNLWRRYPQRWEIQGAETLKDVRRRVSKGIKWLKKEVNEKKNVVLVTHRVICKMVAMILLGISNSGFWRLKFDPASVSIFEYDGLNFVAIKINETSHLKDHVYSYRDF